VLKLDALAYVGDDEAGERVATLGDLPKLVSGLPHDLRKRSPGISSLIARPAGDVWDEEPEGEHRIERKGGDAPNLKPIEVEGWGEFKDRYADTFGPYLAHLQRQAKPAWEIDRLVEEFGEGIIVVVSRDTPSTAHGAQPPATSARSASSAPAPHSPGTWVMPGTTSPAEPEPVCRRTGTAWASTRTGYATGRRTRSSTATRPRSSAPGG
jgi:hypothetical protein